MSELALTLYAQRLSLGKTRELAGLTLWEFRQWLSMRRIAAHYNQSDVQDDLDWTPCANRAVWRDQSGWLLARRKFV